MAVRWSDALAVRTDGEQTFPELFRVEYQDLGRGGCINTIVEAVQGGVVQRTKTNRTAPPAPPSSAGREPPAGLAQRLRKGY